MNSRSLRQKPRISYYEPEEPSLDEYLFCDECCDYVYEYCSIHGDLLIIPDDKVPTKTNIPSYVPRAALTIPKVFLHIAPSIIPGAGLGVYSTLTLPRGVRFGPYGGQKTQRVTSMYCWQIYDRDRKRSHVVDAGDDQRSNWMRYVNCARHWHEQNLVAYQYQGQLYYRTIKIIPRYTELMVFYGGEFAHRLNIDLGRYNAPTGYAQKFGAPVAKKAKLTTQVEKLVVKSSTKDDTRNNVKASTSNKADSINTKKNTSVNPKSKNKMSSVKIQSNKKTLIKSNNIKVTCVSKSINDQNNNERNIIITNQTPIDIIKDDYIPSYRPSNKEEHCNESNQNIDYNYKTSQGYTTNSKTRQDCTNNSKTRQDGTNISKTRQDGTNNSKTRQDGTNNSKTRQDGTNNSKTRQNGTHIVCGNTDDCNNSLKQSAKNLKSTNIPKHTSDNIICNPGVGSNNVIKNVREHAKEITFTCSYCNKIFNQRSNLIKHIRIHTGDKPYKCNICNKTFSWAGSVKIHILTHSGAKPFKCKICNKTFNNKGTLYNHMLTHSGEKLYSCNVCNKSFGLKHNLYTHRRIHTGEKPFMCNICNKTFSRAGNLKLHMLTHSGEKLYSCNVCNKSFSQKPYLNTHRTIHTGEKPFMCKICNKTFNNTGTLYNHVLTHSGEKPFACKICNKRFSHNGYLNIHSRIHTGEKPYACEICGKQFNQLGNMKTHLKTHM